MRLWLMAFTMCCQMETWKIKVSFIDKHIFTETHRLPMSRPKCMTGKNLQVGVGAGRLWGFTLAHRSVGGGKTDSMSNSFVEGVAYYSTPTSGAANISKKMTRHHNSGILGPVESGEYTSFLLVLIALGDAVSFGNGSYSLEPNSS